MSEPRLPRGSLADATRAIIAAADDFGGGSGPGVTVGGPADRLARAALEAALPAIARSVRRVAAKHALLRADLEAGLRCPSCHGRPAKHSYDQSAKRSLYACGCGREWTGHRYAADDRKRSMDLSLSRLARGEPLPDLPAREDD